MSRTTVWLLQYGINYTCFMKALCRCFHQNVTLTGADMTTATTLCTKTKNMRAVKPQSSYVWRRNLGLLFRTADNCQFVWFIKAIRVIWFLPLIHTVEEDRRGVWVIRQRANHLCLACFLRWIWENEEIWDYHFNRFIM